MFTFFERVSDARQEKATRAHSTVARQPIDGDDLEGLIGGFEAAIGEVVVLLRDRGWRGDRGIELDRRSVLRLNSPSEL
jgi:hypothetical protein